MLVCALRSYRARLRMLCDHVAVVRPEPRREVYLRL